MERRSEDRRKLALVPEAIERRSDRRADERRECPRRPAPVEVHAGEHVERLLAEVALRGASWKTDEPFREKELTVKINLPTGPVQTRAEVIQQEAHLYGTRVRVRFIDMPLKAELALAHYLEQAIATARTA